MTRAGAVIFLGVGWLAAALAATPALAAPAEDSIVVVLSWDGVRHDFPDRGELPNLQRMDREGLRAGRLIPVFPSSTFPGHVSLATGTYPDRHGIVDNHFIDAARGSYRMSSEADWIDAEPLWIAAERQGVSAATYFWVGSETDWHGQGTRYRIAPFDGGRPDSAKVDQTLAWLALPPAERPRLIMSYWSGVDHQGHDYGPDSDAVTGQMQVEDEQLGRLLQGIDDLGLWPLTTLIIVSDHGMAEMARYLDLTGALEDAGVAAEVTGSAVANVYLEDPAQAEAALAAIRALQPVQAWRRDDVPVDMRMVRDDRSGDVVVVTEPPFTFSRLPGVAGYLRSALYMTGLRSFGGHGYDPRHPDMGGIFFALGRGVPADLVLPEVQQVDLAPTVSRLLGIEPPRQSEGRAVRGIGENLIGGEVLPVGSER